MQRFDFSEKLHAGFEQVPGERWAKFNNSWLYLGRRGNKRLYLVAYQAAAFLRKGERGDRWVPLRKGYPGEIGSMWGTLIPKVWGKDPNRNTHNFWGGIEPWSAIGIALVRLRHRGESPEEVPDAVMDDVVSEPAGDDGSSDDMSDISLEDQAAAIWERLQEDEFEEDGTADMPDQLSECEDSDGPFITDIEVLSDQLFPELTNCYYPELLFDSSKKQIYLAAQMIHNREDVKGPYGDKLRKRPYSIMRQLKCFDHKDDCELQRQFILGPETITIPGNNPSHYEWPIGGCKFFEKGSLVILPKKGHRKKSSTPLSHNHPGDAYIQIKSQKIASNIGDLERRVSHLKFGDHPVGKVNMDGPLLEVPRLGILPAGEKNVRRYLGVGRLRINCYEIYYLIDGILSRYFEENGIRFDEMAFDDKLAHISEVCNVLKEDQALFKRYLEEAFAALDGQIETHLPLICARWTDEERTDPSDAIVKELLSHCTNEFSTFVFALFRSGHEEKIIFSDDVEPFVPAAYQRSGEFPSDTPPILPGEVVLPPQNLCMAFFYDVLIGEGGENKDRPKEAWHHYRFSDAFLLKDDAGIDPYINATNLAFAPEDTYLMGYGASDHYAKVTSFSQWDIEDRLERRGRPSDRMLFEFI